MNRLMKLFAKLYPAAWRNRYESEFTALLEDVNPSWRTTLDILKGAVTMQLLTLSSRKLVFLSGVIGLAIGLSVWLAMPSFYRSTAVFHYANADQVMTDAKQVLSEPTLNSLIQKYDLYPSKRGAPAEELLTKMRNDITIRPTMAASSNGRFSAATLEFSYPDAKTAQLVAQDLTSRFGGQLIDPASLPTSPISPNPKPLAIIGLAGGLLVGGTITLLRRRAALV